MNLKAGHVKLVVSPITHLHVPERACVQRHRERAWDGHPPQIDDGGCTDARGRRLAALERGSDAALRTCRELRRYHARCGTTLTCYPITVAAETITGVPTVNFTTANASSVTTFGSDSEGFGIRVASWAQTGDSYAPGITIQDLEPNPTSRYFHGFLAIGDRIGGTCRRVVEKMRRMPCGKQHLRPTPDWAVT